MNEFYYPSSLNPHIWERDTNLDHGDIVGEADRKGDWQRDLRDKERESQVCAEVVVVGAAAPRHAPDLGVVPVLVRDRPDAEGAVGRGQDPAVRNQGSAAEGPICEKSLCIMQIVTAA